MKTTSYSTTVRGWLTIDSQTFELAQVGPEHCYVREPIDLSPTSAELSISVDGNVSHQAIQLPQGMTSQSKKVMIRRQWDRDQAATE